MAEVTAARRGFPILHLEIVSLQVSLLGVHIMDLDVVATWQLYSRFLILSAKRRREQAS